MTLRTLIFALFFSLVFAASHGYALEMKVIYYHNDTLGSPRVATDEDGNELWRENYAPFGKKLENEAKEQGNHIGYTGKPHERITGFTYLNARYYDPVIGRFMAIDPVGPVEGGVEHFGRYIYANNNPFRYIDPTGLDPFSLGDYGGYVPILVWESYKTDLIDPAKSIAQDLGETASPENLDTASRISDMATIAALAAGQPQVAAVTGTLSALASVGAAMQSEEPAKKVVMEVALDVVANKTVKTPAKIISGALDLAKKNKFYDDVLKAVAENTTQEAHEAMMDSGNIDKPNERDTEDDRGE